MWPIPVLSTQPTSSLTYEIQYGRPAWRSEAPAAPEFTDKHQDRLFGRTTLLGSADQIVSSLLAIRQAAGMAVEFVARSHFPTLRNSDQVELTQNLAEEVAIHI